MLREISFEKFQEWVEFERLEPFEEMRGDWRTAHIVSTLANIYRGKNDDVHPIAKFVLPFGDRKPWEPEPTAEELMAKAKAAFLLYSGVDEESLG